MSRRHLKKVKYWLNYKLSTKVTSQTKHHRKKLNKSHFMGPLHIVDAIVKAKVKDSPECFHIRVVKSKQENK